MIAKLSSIVRETLESRLGRPSVGWLWVAALLALPDCGFSVGVEPPAFNPLPHTTLVYCDIERPLERHCATAIDKAMGIRVAAAAVALAAGESGGNIGLDDSPAALARCGGEPEAVTFRGPFPIGNPLCLNGFAIGPPLNDPTLSDPLYADPNAACAAQCQDFFDDPADPSVKAFCQQRAHASTNVSRDPNPGFAGGCTPGGIAVPNYPDPRRVPERVIWVDGIGVASSGNDLKRTAAATSPTDFNAGAASDQWISQGDGYVEFATPDQPTAFLSHVAGLSTVHKPALGCLFNACADTDPSLKDLDFGISLNLDGFVYVLEKGGSQIFGPFCKYAPGERFRVTSTGNPTLDSHTITYSKISGPSDPVQPCSQGVFHTSTTPAEYPLRVDASFREKDAMLSDVRIVRIH